MPNLTTETVRFLHASTMVAGGIRPRRTPLALSRVGRCAWSRRPWPLCPGCAPRRRRGLGCSSCSDPFRFKASVCRLFQYPTSQRSSATSRRNSWTSQRSATTSAVRSSVLDRHVVDSITVAPMMCHEIPQIAHQRYVNSTTPHNWTGSTNVYHQPVGEHRLAPGLRLV